MPRLPRDFSILDLERLLERRKSEVSSLSRERERLQKQLAVIDNKIRDLGGQAKSSVTVSRRGRPRNAGSLVATLSQILASAGAPMKVGDIAQAVLDSGYKSSAANFRGLVNQTLVRERKRFDNASRGMYALKK